MSAGARPAKAVHEAVALVASAARLVTGTGDAVRLPQAPGYVFTLQTTDLASAVDDTLDVFVQTKLDGTNWTDVVHFTQKVGNGTDASRHVAKITPAALAEAMFEVGSALAAGAVRNLAGDEWRVRWDIVAGAGTHAFTFSVSACRM